MLTKLEFKRFDSGTQVWGYLRDQVLGKIGDPVADQVWVRVWYPVKAQLKQDIEC